MKFHTLFFGRLYDLMIRLVMPWSLQMFLCLQQMPDTDKGLLDAAFSLKMLTWEQNPCLFKTPVSHTHYKIKASG